jgi:hypothetical protein
MQSPGSGLGEAEEGAALVHVDQALSLQALDAGAVLGRGTALAQERQVHPLDDDATVDDVLDGAGDLEQPARSGLWLGVGAL